MVDSLGADDVPVAVSSKNSSGYAGLALGVQRHAMELRVYGVQIQECTSKIDVTVHATAEIDEYYCSGCGTPRNDG